MRAALKAAAVALPFLLVFVGIRACAGGAAERWQSRVARYEPGARVVLDTPKLIVIASDRERGARVGRQVQRFRDALIEQYGDLIGRGRGQRTVVVLFSTLARLRAYADGPDPRRTGRTKNLHGFTVAAQNAIFLPPQSTLTTLRHESVHLLMEETHGDSTRYSPWLSEGLAQLLETFDPDANPPAPPGLGGEIRAAIARGLGDTIDVRRLLRLQDYDTFTGAEVSRNYLEALALTAFLFERREREQLRRYVELERAYPRGREQAFERVYAYRQPLFQRDLSLYLRQARVVGGR